MIILQVIVLEVRIKRSLSLSMVEKLRNEKHFSLLIFTLLEISFVKVIAFWKLKLLKTNDRLLQMLDRMLKINSDSLNTFHIVHRVFELRRVIDEFKVVDHS